MNLKLIRNCIGVVVLLAGCAGPRQPPDLVAGEPLSGRLSVHVDATPVEDAHNITAAFELHGSAEHGRLDLSTPLGTLIARAHWAPSQVALVTSKGETRFANLDALTHEVLGESVPLAALFDWLNGRPWPGAPSVPTTSPMDAGFVQLGWVVSLARFNEGWVAARRSQAPVVTVRAKLDRP